MNQLFERVGIVLIVVRNKKGQYLAVLETKDRGWWLPGGRVDPGETFEVAAIRETLEEAKIDVNLKGILRVEYDIDQYTQFMRFKVVYYAEPKSEDQIPKQFKDKESIMALWVNYEQLPELGEKPYWRGSELLDWSSYLENGGEIMPLSTFNKEGGKVEIAKPFQIKDIKQN